MEDVFKAQYIEIDLLFILIFDNCLFISQILFNRFYLFITFYRNFCYFPSYKYCPVLFHIRYLFFRVFMCLKHFENIFRVNCMLIEPKFIY